MNLVDLSDSVVVDEPTKLAGAEAVAAWNLVPFKRKENIVKPVVAVKKGRGRPPKRTVENMLTCENNERLFEIYFTDGFVN